MYFWFQKDGQSAWMQFQASDKQRIIEEERPAFVTVLACSRVPEEDWKREDYDGLRYKGPLYFDWDGEWQETTDGLRNFLDVLKNDYKVDLEAIRIYATGGRGYHVEIPEFWFADGAGSRTGTQFLPAIYKEMAHRLFTQCMDMRIYTARKGRMWRVPNLPREPKVPGGPARYKVPITPEQAYSFTEQDYIEWCLEPHPLPEFKPGTHSVKLAGLFQTCRDKVSGAVRQRRKSQKANEQMLKAFDGVMPASIEALMDGKLPTTGGFNQIALQLAIAAHSFGISEEDLVARCEGLVQNHVSDGSYNTPAKRRKELRNKWYYTESNDCYSYSAGGMMGIVSEDHRKDVKDLSPKVAPSGFGPADKDADGNLTPNEGVEAAKAQFSAYVMTRQGFFYKTKDAVLQVSNVGMENPCLVRTLTVDPTKESDPTDIEVSLWVTDTYGTHAFGRAAIPVNHFTSKAKLQPDLLRIGGRLLGSDDHVTALSTHLQAETRRSGNTMYVVHREGLDLIADHVNSATAGKPNLIPIWVSPSAMMTHQGSVPVRFKPLLSKTSHYDADAHQCNPLEDTPDTREWLTALLTMNDSLIVANMLGWFTSALHRQFYHHAFGQFPLLHPNGLAGTGKTMTTQIMGRMYMVNRANVMHSASDTTPYSLKAAFASSASIPLILDEYKPSEMDRSRANKLRDFFRLAYNMGSAGTGGGDSGAATSSYRDVTEYAFAAPTVFIGETEEQETATLQRSVSVCFTQQQSRLHTASFERVQAEVWRMGQLGRVLISSTLGVPDGNGGWAIPPETVDSRRDALKTIRDDLRKTAPAHVIDRQIFNMAVCIAGLQFMDDAVAYSLETQDFRSHFARLRDAIYSQKSEIQFIKSEPTKVLCEMSAMSRSTRSTNENWLVENQHYTVVEGKLHLKMHEAFHNYQIWARSADNRPIYTSWEQFAKALHKHPAFSGEPDHSPLRTNSVAKVYSLTLSVLNSEGVEPFGGFDETGKRRQH